MAAQLISFFSPMVPSRAAGMESCLCHHEDIGSCIVPEGGRFCRATERLIEEGKAKVECQLHGLQDMYSGGRKGFISTRELNLGSCTCG